MPIYEYHCATCNERMEMIQKISDPPFTHCPKCSGELRKLISSPAIQFKGSGFYKTDYASGGSGNGSSTTASKSESSPASSETKSTD
jgi:putative FmdB family regulatory protein